MFVKFMVNAMLVLGSCAVFAPAALAQETTEEIRPATPDSAPSQDEGSQPRAAADAEDRHVDDQPRPVPHNNTASILREVAKEGASTLNRIEQPEREFDINDIIKIRITESATASDTSKLETNRDFSIEASLDDYFKLSTKNGDILPQFATPNDINPQLNLESKTERDNEGKASKTRSFRSFISGKIVDVKPNGTLVISADKTILIDEEEQKISLTGIVRKEDVSPDNVVDSTDLADLTIEYVGQGPVSDASKRGLFGKIFDAIWPF